jgi:mono/diheme cytochrome c family protein
MKRAIAVAVIALTMSSRAWGADVKEGAQIFRAHCATCHGLDGKGEGPVARNYDPPPVDLTKGVFRHGSSEADLTKTVTLGIPSTGMTGWKGRLTSAEIASVVAYVQSLKKK